MQRRMRPVDIVAPREAADTMVRAVHRLGVLHLARFEAPPGVGPATFAGVPALAGADRIAGWLATVRELGQLIGDGAPEGAELDRLWGLDRAGLAVEAGRAEAMHERAAALAAERLRLAAEAERYGAYRRIIGGLRVLVPRLPSIRGYGSTAIVLDARYRALVAQLGDELEALTDGRSEVIAADLDPDRVAAILVYPVRCVGEVRAFLGSRDIEEVTLPESLTGVPLDELEPRLDAEIERATRGIATTEAELAKLREGAGPWAESLRRVLADRQAEALALRGAAASDHLVVLSGYVPDDEVDALRDGLARALGDRVLVVPRPVPGRAGGATPVALANRGAVRAFEPLAAFVALPRYGTIDPTPLLALTFPAFVGLMVGDAGYGLVALALLILARRRWRDRAAMAIVWPIGVLAASATIAFGVLYGEWFGSAGAALFGLRPLWLDREHGVMAVLVLAISIGVVHVVLGLVLGVANAVILRHRREAVGRVALLIGLLAALLLGSALAELVPGAVGPAAAVVLVTALVVASIAIGVAGPVEMVGVVGNILSYARLGAIGLASVMLALVANRLGGIPENVAVGALVALAVHALNIVLGFFDSSVQGLRLHYVEFFGRFVESGGVRYQPFTSALGPPADAPAGR